MTLYLDDPFQRGTIDPSEMFITADIQDVSIVDHGTIPERKMMQFALPWNWRELGAQDPATEVRIVGVNTYDGHPTPLGQKERGDDVWLGFQVMFPSGNVLGGNFIFAQFHSGKQADGTWGNPHLSLRVKDAGELSVRRRDALPDESGTTAIDYDTGITVEPGRWYSFVLHTKWTTGTDGILDAWIDGEQFIDYRGRTVGDIAYHFSTNLKIGMYAPFMRKTNVQQNITQITNFDQLRYGPGDVGYNAVVPKVQNDNHTLLSWLNNGDTLLSELSKWIDDGRRILG